MASEKEKQPLLSSGSDNSESSFPTADGGLVQRGAHRNLFVRAFVPDWLQFSPSRIQRSYRVRSLFSVKPLEKFREEREARPEGQRLAESLGVVDLLAYGVGSTVGAGIYSLIGVAAGIAGPGITISFIIGAISAILTALSYSEFAARVPVTGSAYSYGYASFGELLAWIIGWNLTLEYCISSAAIARGWGDYFYSFWFHWGFTNTPTWLNHLRVGSADLSPAAAAIIILCTLVMLFGISSSSTFNVIMTILNLFVLIFFSAVGATQITPSNWVSVNNSFIPYGAASLFSGAGTIFFSYLGFDMVSSLAEETKNPQKNLPRGIIGSLVVAASVYFSVSFVATGMVDFIELTPNKTDAPLSAAFYAVGLDWAAKVVSFGSLFGLTTATFSGLLGQPRIFYVMARDGLLFPFFHWTKFDIPFIGTILTGVFTTILAFFMTLGDLADAISIGTLLAFSLVCAGVMVLRYTNFDGHVNFLPVTLISLYCLSCFLAAICFHYEAPLPITLIFAIVSLLIFVSLCFLKTVRVPTTFKCPLVPLVPCAGIAFNMMMMAGLQYEAWIRLGVWMLVGFALYGFYGIYCSKMRLSDIRPPTPRYDFDSSSVPAIQKEITKGKDLN